MNSKLQQFLNTFRGPPAVINRAVEKPTFDVLFLCSSLIDETWIRSTAQACRDAGLSVCLCVCSEGENEPEIRAIYDDAEIPCFLNIAFAEAAKIPCLIAVTASSGLERTIFPTTARTFVHMPHSLASLHMIYPEDAFFGYDVLFAAGPQHVAEFEAICAANKLADRQCFSVGYGKLDILKDKLYALTSVEHRGAKKHVLLAPSWGNDNLLERCGVDLCTALLAAGFRVTVRPHPLLFIENVPVFDEIKTIADKNLDLVLESPLIKDKALLTADIMIGDYSGISYEFAALRRRPVVSVDVGLKVVNETWEALDLLPVEIRCRSAIGTVVKPDVRLILASVAALLDDDRDVFVDEETISEFLFSAPGSCGQRACELLHQMIRGMK
jgi:hypothetical protein